jgi:hypothetical protein
MSDLLECLLIAKVTSLAIMIFLKDLSLDVMVARYVKSFTFVEEAIIESHAFGKFQFSC